MLFLLLFSESQLFFHALLLPLPGRRFRLQAHASIHCSFSAQPTRMQALPIAPKAKCAHVHSFIHSFIHERKKEKSPGQPRRAACAAFSPLSRTLCPATPALPSADAKFQQFGLRCPSVVDFFPPCPSLLYHSLSLTRLPTTTAPFPRPCGHGAP